MANDRNQGPGKIMVPKDRVFQRNHGCHDCRHWDQEGAVKRWSELRQRDLATALEISLKSVHREDDPKVVTIRRHVDDLDHSIAKGGTWAPCKGNGRLANGNPVGDLTHRTLLCERWTGIPGAASSGPMDTLPEELRDKVDN